MQVSCTTIEEMVLQLAELDDPPHRTGASPAAIISHYDMGEEFFQLVLDPDLVYSCALFEAGDSLWDAQRRKLDHHIQASGAATAKRVLDIGCGWGALLRRLSDHWGVENAVGLTLSPSQANFIRRMPRKGLGGDGAGLARPQSVGPIRRNHFDWRIRALCSKGSPSID